MVAFSRIWAHGGSIFAIRARREPKFVCLQKDHYTLAMYNHVVLNTCNWTLGMLKDFHPNKNYNKTMHHGFWTRTIPSTTNTTNLTNDCWQKFGYVYWNAHTTYSSLIEINHKLKLNINQSNTKPHILNKQQRFHQNFKPNQTIYKKMTNSRSGLGLRGGRIVDGHRPRSR